jgi:hypothetical protein
MSNTSIIKRGIAAVTTIFFVLGFTAPSFADLSLGGNSWVDSIKFGGDLRLRHDTLQEMGGRTDRNRERYRLRFGTEVTVQDVMAKIQFASGTGSQLSANQTESGQFSQNSLWIDEAYLQWKATPNIKLLGGRMSNPFWQLYASECMWDPDLKPEGYAEKVDVPVNDRLGLFANVAQMPTTDAFTSAGSATSDKNVWIFGEQIGAKTTLFEETKLTMAIADYGFINETTNPMGGTTLNPGNSINAAGTLLTPFNIMEFTNELAFHAGPLPLSLQLEYVTNTQYQRGAGTAALRGSRNGYQTGVIAGKAAAKGTWEGAYFFKYLGQNATVANLADDDLGNGGTNRAGHIFWIAYAPRDYVQVKLKYYITRVLDQTLTTAGAAFTGQNGDTNRLMLDVMLKF